MKQYIPILKIHFQRGIYKVREQIAPDLWITIARFETYSLAKEYYDREVSYYEKN